MDRTDPSSQCPLWQYQDFTQFGPVHCPHSARGQVEGAQGTLGINLGLRILSQGTEFSEFEERDEIGKSLEYQDAEGLKHRVGTFPQDFFSECLNNICS